MSSYDDIMALNKKIEESPKSMGCFVLFMKSIAVLIILMGIMLCLIKPISGILAIIFGILILLLFRTKNKNLNSNNLIPNVSDDNTHSEFEFPETDKNGKSLLKIYDINVTGVMHKQDGVDPQTIIPQLYLKPIRKIYMTKMQLKSKQYTDNRLVGCRKVIICKLI